MNQPFRLDDKKIKISVFMKGKSNIDEARKLIKKSLKKYVEKKVLPFSYISSLKSMGLLKRTDGTYRLGSKYATILPKLRPTSSVGKTHKYKLSDRFAKRKLAIDEGIIVGAKTYGSIRDAALKKKGRLNILRIYRRYKNPKECRLITRDMKYINKEYISGGSTKNICSKKKL